MKAVPNLIFQAIVGSQAYGLATETSDTDIKGVYMQDTRDFLVMNQYKSHTEINKDEFYYELRNFLGLLAVGNPTAIELLFSPSDCILEITPEFELLQKFRGMFMTKQLYDSFGGYAVNQLRKAHGLNKKFNWENSRVERKDVLDFCQILDRESGEYMIARTWLRNNGIEQEQIGLTKMQGFRDSFKVYHDSVLYRGIIGYPSTEELEKEIALGDISSKYNEVRTSIVPKEFNEHWLGVLYFNKEAYSTHCRDYKSYKEWELNRNQTRYRESREGKKYDGKNIMHTARLIITVEEFHKTGTINLDMSDYREELLRIKKGDVDLEPVFKHYTERAENIKNLKAKSDLVDKVSMEFVEDLEYNLRLR